MGSITGLLIQLAIWAAFPVAFFIVGKTYENH